MPSPRRQFLVALGLVCSSFYSHKESFCSIPLFQWTCPSFWVQRDLRDLSELARHCKLGEWSVQGKAVLSLKVTHILCPQVKTHPQWVSGRAGARAEKEKGPNCTWGSRVNSKCFTLNYPSFMAIIVTEAGAPHLLQFWAVKVNMFLLCFIFMHGSGSFIGPRADSESRLHMPALRTEKTAQILSQAYQGTKSAVETYLGVYRHKHHQAS